MLKYFLLAAALPSAMFGFSSGAPIYATGVPTDPVTTTCARCHSTFRVPNPDGPFQDHLKVETFNYRPGQRQTIKVTVTHPEALRWGFELTARLASDTKVKAGTFIVDPTILIRCNDDPGVPNGRPVTNENPCPATSLEFATHTQPQTLTGSNGTKTFMVDWIAPVTDVGDVLFFASGNAANNNGNNQGDRIYNNAESPFRISAEGGTCPNATRPTLRAAANAASGRTDVSMNTLISIYGMNFVAQGTKRSAGVADFRDGYPKELACVAVEVGGTRIPLTYVQPDQINAQLPTGVASGTVSYKVIVNPGRPNEMVSDTGTLTVTNYAPAFFTFGSNGKNIAAVHMDGALAVDPAVVAGGRVVKPGDIVQLYATGLGPTDPVWQAGEFPNRASSLRDRLMVTIGGTTLAASDVLYAGVAPTFISGLYQVNVRIPAAMSDGDAPVTISIGGMTSPTGTVLPIRR